MYNPQAMEFSIAVNLVEPTSFTKIIHAKQHVFLLIPKQPMDLSNIAFLHVQQVPPFIMMMAHVNRAVLLLILKDQVEISLIVILYVILPNSSMRIALVYQLVLLHSNKDQVEDFNIVINLALARYSSIPMVLVSVNAIIMIQLILIKSEIVNILALLANIIMKIQHARKTVLSLIILRLWINISISVIPLVTAQVFITAKTKRNALQIVPLHTRARATDI